MSEPTTFPEVGEELDDFLLVQLLGRGAFATVFLAWQRSMQRNVALKISAEAGHEPATLARLDHPHIVRVYDVRLLPDRGWRLLSMEVVSAGTLEDVIEHVRSGAAAQRGGRILLDTIDGRLASREEPPPSDSRLRSSIEAWTWPQTVAWIGAQLAEALDHAHTAQVLHRDVKPANVLLAANGSIKLADFNVGHAASVVGDDPSSFLGGSLAYMSPEQLEAMSPFHERAADALDGRSDLYALGVMLYELLTGVLPYKPGDPSRDGGWEPFLDGMLAARMNTVPQSVAALPAALPEALRTSLASAVQPAAESRPPDGRALAERLRLALHPAVERRVFARRTGGWRTLAWRSPRMAVFVATAMPSVVLSALNIAYNLASVVARDPTWASFERQVALVNAAAYAIGVGFLVRLVQPVARALAAVERGKDSTPEDVEATHALPIRVAGVVLPLWILGGLAFPVWRTLAEGSAHGGAWFHFGASNLLFGVLAAAGALFTVGALAQEVFLPSLWAALPRAQRNHAPLKRWSRWMRLALAANIFVPLASVAAYAVEPAGDRVIYPILAAMGLAAAGLGGWLFAAVHRRMDEWMVAFPEQ